MYEMDVKKQRIDIINMVYENKFDAHLSPAMAMLEIFNVLIRDIMNIDDGIDSDLSDKLVLSNGHVALGLYAVYKTMGIISRDDFYSYKKRNSRFGIHQDRLHTPGSIVSTGSLGHGLPNAVGIAYAWKLQGKKNKMYVTVGDGELNEGSIWESIIFAARMKLDNLCCIIDDNKSTEYMPNIKKKFEAFDWNAEEVDGHNEYILREIFQKNYSNDKPVAIIANTIKGKGVSLFEKNHALWHDKIILPDEYDLIMKELCNERNY